MNAKDQSNLPEVNITTNIGQIERLVIKWAQDRQIIKGPLGEAQSNSKQQIIKLYEEMYELLRSVINGNDPIDDIGDCLVVLTIIANMHDLNLQRCFACAYNDIKNRKGRMINGVFVKEASPIDPETISNLDHID
jgi:NTP pyrophosphatase (non-canonical NTP hydrolase)